MYQPIITLETVHAYNMKVISSHLSIKLIYAMHMDRMMVTSFTRPSNIYTTTNNSIYLIAK